MSGAFSFRDAVPGDEAIVAGFVQALAEYEKLSHEAVATEADFARALFGAPARCQAMIVEADGQPVGFALWFYNFSTFTGRPGLYLEDVYVLPERRGQGIGRAVFRELARRAIAEGCARMEWSVLDSNAPAVKFYRSLGARPKDEWTMQQLSGETLAAVAA
ncbi:GNAT family N-acetyltransferase [Limobrevibacterium gyesilva]|uniref:GNAT family N-acetyltransferase n=1 Tax=Limobrevibacterium gyesilva TaxID=2991712 RepID=A0AA41YS05_9PROT|nr:GNAT family N-acetyltransferase [Limobrevibacterium gyesilva]